MTAYAGGTYLCGGCGNAMYSETWWQKPGMHQTLRCTNPNCSEYDKFYRKPSVVLELSDEHGGEDAKAKER